VEGEALQGYSDFSYNTFQHTPLKLYASNQTSVGITGNDFLGVGNVVEGLILNQVSAELQCNRFKNLAMGILLKEGTAYLNEDAYNHFYGNTVAVNFDPLLDATLSGLYLDQGRNEFLLGPGNPINKRHIIGAFKADLQSGTYSNALPQSDYQIDPNTGKEEMMADNNRFELIPCGITAPCPVMPVDMEVTQPTLPHGSTSLGSVRLHVPNNLGSVNSPCSNVNPNSGVRPVYAFIQSVNAPNDGGLIGGTGNSVKPTLLSAINDLSYQEQVNDDPAALNTFQTIVNGPISNPDASTPLLLSHSKELMLLALENSFTRNFFPFEGENPEAEVHPEVTEVLNLLDNLLGQLNSNDPHYAQKHFTLHLDKVMSLRNGGYYTPALNLLSQSGTWTHNYTQQQRAGYWSCVCQAESDYFSGSLPVEEFGQVLQQCKTQFAGYTYKRNTDASEEPGEGYVVEDQAPRLKVYPQPVEEVLHLRFSAGLEQEIVLELSSLEGKLLRQETRPIAGDELAYDTEDLSPGLYILWVNTGADTFRRKILIR